MSRVNILSLIVLVLASLIVATSDSQVAIENSKETINETFRDILPTPSPISIPQSKILDNGGYHIFQTFNNCGPASLSMAFSFYEIDVSQKVLGDSLRPYQVATGDNDDKSTTLEELAEKSREFGFIPLHRPNGNPEIVKRFIANGMPVVTRTWTKPDEDIGHFRVVKGYDDSRGLFIQDDSLQGKGLEYRYEEFDVLWKKFNYEYLVLVPREKEHLIKLILGEEADPNASWRRAVENASDQLQENPSDIYARFNLSVALFNTGDFRESVNEFEKIEGKLPFRTLWYQIEPIQAYFELGEYNRVFEITDRILSGGNRAFSELYLIRGRIYQSQGEIERAREEFEKAVFYNRNLKSALEALDNL